MSYTSLNPGFWLFRLYVKTIFAIFMKAHPLREEGEHAPKVPTFPTLYENYFWIIQDFSDFIWIFLIEIRQRKFRDSDFSDFIWKLFQNHSSLAKLSKFELPFFLTLLENYLWIIPFVREAVEPWHTSSREYHLNLYKNILHFHIYHVTYHYFIFD